MNNYYLKPDYSEEASPSEDDDDVLEKMLSDEDEEDDIRVEMLLDEQATFNDNLNNNNSMSSNFGSAPPWSNGNNNNQGSTPWQSGGTSWKPGGSGSSWGSGWGSGNSANSGSGWNNNNTTTDNFTVMQDLGHRDVVVIDALDGLVESYASDGRPNVAPRAIFDMKLKFEIWDRVAALSPKKVCIILPAEYSVPSLGNSQSAAVAMEYLASSLAVYLRIPRQNCMVFRQMRQDHQKDRVLQAILRATGVNHNDQIMYLGVYCGDWGLSTADKDAADRCKIDCISIYHLLGKI